MVESDLCSFCRAEKETILHLFVYCEKIRNLWKEVNEYILSEYGVEIIDPTAGDILFKQSWGT